jgi:hypothetical protein
MFITGLGAVFFGLVIGWISYRTLRLTAGTNLLSAIAIIIATVGGAAVVTLLKDEVMFGWYAIGLVIGFLVSFVLGLGLYGKQELQLSQMPPATAPITPAKSYPSGCREWRVKVGPSPVPRKRKMSRVARALFID